MYPPNDGTHADPGSAASAARRRQRLLICSALASGSAALLGVLLALVTSHWGPLARLDQGWVDSLHGYAVQHNIWTAAMQTLADIGSTVTMRVLLGLAAVWLWVIGARTLGGWAAALILAGWLASWLGKNVVGRERPHFAAPVAQAGGLSFPSGHALASAITCAALVILVWPRANRTGRAVSCTAAALAALAVGWTRIALGVHWPSDVLAGWLAAALVVGTVTLAVELWQPGALSRDVRRVDWRTRPRIQRVLATGTPDPAFDPSLDSAFDPAAGPFPQPARRADGQ
ncbi:undecaprenyl-diphosphatase [Kitasatospora gansuensis]|uniref:Undecaprenyl-diphosphatase n=1 Tax=Kitasatospora gansuensis TaxID=258050 RepID=A0A7W7SBE4_9ACTN|nr:phosphatase PAP2 family protein [Kitasatospora gansuensis]MBB4947349.1 undecaprenyl-diphosphatase [Kitasatospora gansuensis]